MTSQSAQIMKVGRQSTHYDGVSLLKLPSTTMNFAVMMPQSAQVVEVGGQEASSVWTFRQCSQHLAALLMQLRDPTGAWVWVRVLGCVSVCAWVRVLGCVSVCAWVRASGRVLRCLSGWVCWGV